MTPRSRLPTLVLAVGLVAGACTGSGEGGTTSTVAEATESSSLAGDVAAPEFPEGLDWLNTEGPLTMADLRGKVVVLDFWTYGCINCMHIIPDLKRLEEEYPDELVVIGVHSAKFENESVTENIRQVIVRYGLEHPVVNDRDFQVWSRWGANAWPTLALIDPAGNVVGVHSGEGVYPLFKPVIESLVREFDAEDRIDRSAIELSLERDEIAETVLSFPGKVVADAEGGRLFVADTNHHRIVIADPETGEVLDVAGTGEPGMAEGGFSVASFDRPQGMALAPDRSLLYVADVGNHSIRVVDLEARTVSTLVGTGLQADTYPPTGGTAPAVSLSSPWDVELDGDRLLVAMAGSHQIWGIDLDDGRAAPVVGSGREGTANRSLASAELAQPSGLALDGSGTLYFADAESSAIRSADFGADETALVAGSDADLFDFGDLDGVGREARLQHPLGIAYADGLLFVADTYNSKIKTIELGTGRVATLAGGEQGWRDGGDPRFFEPGGLDHAGGRLYVADTNNHVIRVVDPTTGAAETLVLYGVERFEGPGDGFRGTVVELDPVTVAPGEGTLIVDVELPDGYKTNDLAPFTMTWTATDAVADPGPDANREIVAPGFPLEATATFNDGSGELSAELTVYYCATDNQALCFIEQVRITVPVEVAPNGAPAVRFPYEIVPPQL